MAAGAVMIARCAHDGHGWMGVVNGYQCVGQHALDGCRRLVCMEHIAAEQEGIGLLLVHQVGHLLQHGSLLLGAVMVVEAVPKVPVACVKYLHEFLFASC